MTDEEYKAIIGGTPEFWAMMQQRMDDVASGKTKVIVIGTNDQRSLKTHQIK